MSECRIFRNAGCRLFLPGHHNVLNATAAIALAAELGVADESIRSALENFAGIGRRVQHHGELILKNNLGTVSLYDDYGHHPTEVNATLQAMRAGWPERRLVVVFQPHRYTRTRDLFEDFAEALSQPDILLLTEIYSAGEEKIKGADGRSLARAIRNRGQVDPIFVADIDNVPSQLETVLQDGDVLLTLGAGSVGGLRNSARSQLLWVVGPPSEKFLYAVVQRFLTHCRVLELTFMQSMLLMLTLQLSRN